MAQNQKYKASLNIPETNFVMRVHFPTQEKVVQKLWKQHNIARHLFRTNQGAKFFMTDGPAYANDTIHAGTAMNKVLKDFIARAQACLFGRKVIFVCGWDAHGLPIELAVLKKNTWLRSASASAIRTACCQYVLAQIALQKEQFAKLGLLTDLENNSYRTNQFDYELFQLQVFQKLIRSGDLYRALKPVYWSCSSQSALAEAEVEYRNLSSPAIYVKFVVSASAVVPLGAALVIWTTTPWTLPANRLLAVNTAMTYVIIAWKATQIVVAESLLATFGHHFPEESYTVIQKLTGRDLLNTYTIHPLYPQQKIKVVAGHHVTADVGTGIVHIAPGFGADDYLIGLAHKIKPFAPLNDKGCFTVAVGDPTLNGVFYAKANQIIVEKLKDNNNLLHYRQIEHACPVDWRTKKPLILRATQQWFINLKKIKCHLQTIIQHQKWYPVWARDLMLTMIDKRTDWCVSRQRNWGVPLIAFYNKGHQLVINEEIMAFVLQRFVTAKTCDIWYTASANFFLPPQYHAWNLKKETDTMDVWFDSGVAILYLQKRYHLATPVDCILEGKDQFRGWFNSSLILQALTDDNDKQLLFETAVVHGFIVDEQGNKLSKSRQNYVSFDQLLTLYGTDIFRLWVANSDFTSDLKLGNNVMDQTKKQYFKIRNTLRFLLGNLHQFDCQHKCAFTMLPDVDQFILVKTYHLQLVVWQAYRAFNFTKVMQLLHHYLIHDLSNFYLNIAKDVLYVNARHDKRRMQMQYVLAVILEFLIDSYKIVLVHTCEEVYQSWSHPYPMPSVFLKPVLNLRTVIRMTDQAQKRLLQRWASFFQFRWELSKEQEVVKNTQKINRTAEMDVVVVGPSTNHTITTVKTIPALADMLLVHSIVFRPEQTTNAGYRFVITRSRGHKCPRCWKINQDALEDHLCVQCFKIMTHFRALDKN